jgi:hypothetical protein
MNNDKKRQQQGQESTSEAEKRGPQGTRDTEPGRAGQGDRDVADDRGVGALDDDSADIDDADEVDDDSDIDAEIDPSGTAGAGSSRPKN